MPRPHHLLLRYLDVFQPLQLGGVKEMSPYHRYHSFSGCIRNLMVDSQVSAVCVCLSLFPAISLSSPLSLPPSLSLLLPLPPSPSPSL